jgi:hypothetical protein
MTGSVRSPPTRAWSRPPLFGSSSSRWTGRIGRWSSRLGWMPGCLSFVPIDAAGRIVAFNRSGERLASEPMCVGSPAPAELVTGCGNGLSTTFSAVSAQP